MILLSTFTLPLAVNPFEIFPFFGLLIPIIIVPVALYFKYQRQRLWHETARIALEKGQPLPVYTGMDRREIRCSHAGRDVRTGLILIAVSVGLGISPWRVGELGHFNGLWFGSAIPGCIGIALLLNALLTAIFAKKNPTDDSSSRTPANKP